MAARAKYEQWLTDEGLTKLEGWAKRGITDKQIAENIGIYVSTLYAWKNKYPEIAKALTVGKEVADIQVEGALHKSAVGYWVEEEETYIREVEGVKTKHRKIVKKWIQPNSTSIIFYLKNRRPDLYRDRRETEISGGLDVKNPFQDLTTEELKKLIKK